MSRMTVLTTFPFRKNLRGSYTSEVPGKRGAMKQGQGEFRVEKPDHLQSDRQYGPIFLVALSMPDPSSHLGKKDKKWRGNDGFPATYKKG